MPVENMFSMDGPQVEGILSIFNVKQGSQFAVFVVNEQQGRGIDFPSSSEIEQNGGVMVIITCVPQYYMQFRQFTGRTARIGNQGQYQVILFDKQARNCDGESFLQKKLEESKNVEFQEFSNLTTNQYHGQVPAILEGNVLQHLDMMDPSLDHQVRSQNPMAFSQNFEKSNSFHEIAATPGNQDAEQQKGSQLEETKLTPPRTDETVAKKRDHKNLQKDPSNFMRGTRSRDPRKDLVDSLYFENYGEPQIHKEMLEDSVRMDAYSKAIQQLCSGKIVIDVGAGTAALSIIAAQAGAQRVYAIEASNISNYAETLIKQSGCENCVILVRDKAENFSMVDFKADVILSEWMGYFLIKERMFPSVAGIRDRYLAQHGVMIPGSASLYLAAFKRKIDPGRLDTSILDRASNNTASIEICPQDWIVSNPCCILKMDLQNETFADNKFSFDFELEQCTQSSIDGLVSWFDTEMTDSIILTTSPFSKETHWKQTVFHFDREISVKEGHPVVGSISVAPLVSNYRGLRVNFSLQVKDSNRAAKFSFDLD